jgi:hypothetical protein
MSESSETQTRRRWIALGEVIAIAALIVSAIGVWIAWKSTNNDQPTRVVEQRQPIPLTLRAKAQKDGGELVISPVEPSHSLEGVNVAINRSYPEELGSEGILNVEYVEPRLTEKQLEKGVHSIPIGISARYIEMGQERDAQRRDYVLRYRVEGGGILGGRSVRLTGLSR